MNNPCYGFRLGGSRGQALLTAAVFQTKNARTARLLAAQGLIVIETDTATGHGDGYVSYRLSGMGETVREYLRGRNA